MKRLLGPAVFVGVTFQRLFVIRLLDLAGGDGNGGGQTEGSQIDLSLSARHDFVWGNYWGN